MRKVIARLCLMAILLSIWIDSSSALTTDGEEGNPDGRIRHVFVIVLENEGFDVTFGPNSKAPFLSKVLTSQGVLLSQYFGTGHASLDNYIALISYSSRLTFAMTVMMDPARMDSRADSSRQICFSSVGYR